MFLLTIYFLFFSALANGFSGRFLGIRGSQFLGPIALFLALICAGTTFFEVCIQGCNVNIKLFENFIYSNELNVSASLLYDPLAATMTLTVVWISCAVHAYQNLYMRGDGSQTLFISYLSAFTGFMLILVAGQNLIMLFIGWEGIGVCSYLLIGYYGGRVSATKSANKSLIVNKISDGFLLGSMLYLWFYTGSFSYCSLMSFQIPDVVSILVLLGAIGKSSQLFFHVWLADAMEGPTPVSALIHAATLVTAGIYVLCKLNLHSQAIVGILGATTALMGGLFGLAANDLKRVIAFSTCSQLGYMMAVLSICDDGADFAMGHLVSHAGFKATLFLSAGLSIAKENNNFLNRYGSRQGSPTLSFATTIASLNLLGFPELGGFYSKESILNNAYISQGVSIILTLATFLTAFYTSKVLAQLYLFPYGNGRQPKSFDIDTTTLICFALLLSEMLLRIFTGSSLSQNMTTNLPVHIKNLPFWVALSGALSGLATTNLLSANFIRFFGNRGGFDVFYARKCANVFYHNAYVSYTLLDRGFLKLY
uniref:NADH-ubiquinone oxidoreductase chain 5 n=1 Tax=Polytomella piriformis TaxID=351366 RepID=D0VPT8_9CHLO|nr:NADH dehydrogenase subunit 5 [Polytomella piriformis]ACY35568.1 NADH dehydrogenase subunit 5 [Polytomella piriformis]